MEKPTTSGDNDNAIDLGIDEQDRVAETFRDADRKILHLDLDRHVEARNLLDALQRAMDAVERESPPV